METEYLLTATPSARKSLDLNAPIDLDDIRDCLSPAGGRSRKWLRVTAGTARRSRMGLSPLCAAHSSRPV